MRCLGASRKQRIFARSAYLSITRLARTNESLRRKTRRRINFPRCFSVYIFRVRIHERAHTHFAWQSGLDSDVFDSYVARAQTPRVIFSLVSETSVSGAYIYLRCTTSLAQGRNAETHTSPPRRDLFYPQSPRFASPLPSSPPCARSISLSRPLASYWSALH